MRKLRAVALFGALSLTLACGGGSGSSGNGGGGNVPGCSVGTGPSASGNAIAVSAPNVSALTIDGGPPALQASNQFYVNGVFTTVTVCKHGSTPPSAGNCQDIDHVLVDTGSYGLRLLSNNGGGALTLALPAEADPNGSGNVLAECAQFSDGITWGPLRMADIYIGGATVGSGESAKTVPGTASTGMPVQIIGDPGFSTVPSACTSFGTPEDKLSTLLANGIVGIGPFPQDCGAGCNLGTGTGGNPGLYYSCPSGGCVGSATPTAVSVNFQVWNPVAAFTPLTAGAMADNNGDIVELPTVPATGLAVANGSLVFGIGTQNNNRLANAKVYTGDSSANITTTFAGDNYGGNTSFIDSGSNGYFFNFPSGNVATCTGGNFYCPASGSQKINLACSATNIGNNNQSGTIDFTVANLDLLPSNFALNDLAGPNNPPPGSSGPTGFDWGLPFFYGRNVYTGMVPTAGVTSTPPGVPAGPFYAY